MIREVNIRIEAGELISIERSYKFTDEEAHQLFHLAGLRVIQSWSDQSHIPHHSRSFDGPSHSLYVVERAGFEFDEIDSSLSYPLVKLEDEFMLQERNFSWLESKEPVILDNHDGQISKLDIFVKTWEEDSIETTYEMNLSDALKLVPLQKCKILY